jgi:hypothetical protein
MMYPFLGSMIYIGNNKVNVSELSHNAYISQLLPSNAVSLQRYSMKWYNNAEFLSLWKGAFVA